MVESETVDIDSLAKPAPVVEAPAVRVEPPARRRVDKVRKAPCRKRWLRRVVLAMADRGWFVQRDAFNAVGGIPYRYVIQVLTYGMGCGWIEREPNPSAPSAPWPEAVTSISGRVKPGTAWWRYRVTPTGAREAFL